MRVSCLDCVNYSHLPYQGMRCEAGRTKDFSFWLATQLQHKMINCDLFREVAPVRWQCWTNDYTCVDDDLGICRNPYHEGEFVADANPAEKGERG